MAPLKDITNNRVLLFPNEDNIPADLLLLPSPRMNFNRSLSTESNESTTSGSFSRNIRFPPRLSLKSYTEAFSELSPDDYNHSSDEECFFDTSFDSSCSLNTSSSSLLGTPTRRKRLSISSALDESSSFKKMNIDDKNQLVDLVCHVSKLAIDHSKFNCEEASQNTTCLLNREKKLLKNIRRALPDRVYGSTRDAVSFKRVEVHLLVFKQEILKQASTFFQNCLWIELLNYITKSWQIIKHLPQWDNTSHNLHKEQLFKITSSYVRKCLDLGNVDKSTIEKIKSRIVANKTLHSSIEKLLDIF